jgi:hypothetical protein
VADLDEERERLTSVEIPLGRTTDTEIVRTSIATDPDGNQVVLAQPCPPRSPADPGARPASQVGRRQTREALVSWHLPASQGIERDCSRNTESRTTMRLSGCFLVKAPTGVEPVYQVLQTCA